MLTALSLETLHTSTRWAAGNATAWMLWLRCRERILLLTPYAYIGGNPANAGAARLCDVSPHPIPDTTTALPNLSGILFPLVYSGFRRFLICFTYSLALLSPLFPGVPEPYVVIYVVKNASRPVSGELSPVPDGKRFAFQIICIVTLRRVLCKWFLRRRQLKG